jgi:hypothetical protein
MPGAQPSPRLRWLYTRAVICSRFPGYRLHDFEGPDAVPIAPVLQALQLLDTAQKIQHPPKT